MTLVNTHPETATTAWRERFRVRKVIWTQVAKTRPEQYAASSPVTYAEAIRAPLLILQERHDARTPARPIEVYAERLRELDKDLEVHWFETGHMGAVNAEQGIAYSELMLGSVERVFGRPR
jgi:dipeptidyl aminopeptidase/acylaminoacyl peptidase